MPKAEVGSTKYLNNRLKSKGLQRLRWYCQVCERQMRDENGFKMHTQSEGHVRQMLLVGENSKKFIAEYSSQFQRDFIQLLRTSHGEKRVHLNHFYQEYISNKEHVHMNATRWPSLMEFAKFMGREGIARVDEDEKGIYISWVDNSPENLRRQEAIRKRERQDRGDEERELAAVGEQIRRARKDAERRGDVEEDDDAERELKREEGEKIKLSFGAKPKVDSGLGPVNGDGEKTTSDASPVDPTSTPDKPDKAVVTPTLGPARVSMKMGTNNKPKNVFAAAKKNALGGKKSIAIEQPKKMSEAERIMREEMEKGKGKRGFGGSGGGFGGGPEGKRMRM